MRRLLLVLVLLPSMALAACNRGDDPTVNVEGTSSSSSSSTSSSVAETTTSSTAFVPTPLPAVRAASTTRAYLSSVEVGAHDGYDRVVFEFEDALPGYRVAVGRRPVTEDGSGDRIEVKGEVLYEVRFENAAMARITGERVVPVYKGDKRVATRGEVVEEVVNSGDFEGLVTWFVGARPAPTGVKVTTLTSPFRVVVDLGSPR